MAYEANDPQSLSLSSNFLRAIAQQDLMGTVSQSQGDPGFNSLHVNAERSNDFGGHQFANMAAHSNTLNPIPLDQHSGSDLTNPLPFQYMSQSAPFKPQNYPTPQLNSSNEQLIYQYSLQPEKCPTPAFEHERQPKKIIPTKVEAFSRLSKFVDDDDLCKVFDDDISSSDQHKLQAMGLGRISSGGNVYRQNKQLSQASGNAPFLPQKMGSLPIQTQSNAFLKTSEAPSRKKYVEDAQASEFLLPSTLIPPSVLASNSNYCTDKKRKPSSRGSSQKQKRPKQQPAMKPQEVLEQLLEARGIPFRRIASDDAEYDSVPSVLQLASFGTHLVRAVHTSDSQYLGELLECGLSPNPCNQFRDSIIDLVCKRANASIFECLMDHGCDIQVADGFGRTPLHHACWASTFCPSIVAGILARDPIQLCIEDKHGQTPLEYVRSEVREDWIDFIRSRITQFFDENTALNSPRKRRPQGSVVDPPNCLSVNLAALVSSGAVSPAEIAQMDGATRSRLDANDI